jgi:hypothetical protein
MHGVLGQTWRLIVITCCIAAVLPTSGWARGVSPYLPLNLDPEIERQIERVLILADKPVISRPIAAATVLDALPAASRIDPVLGRSVRRYPAIRDYVRSSRPAEGGRGRRGRRPANERGCERQPGAQRRCTQPSDYL